VYPFLTSYGGDRCVDAGYVICPGLGGIDGDID